jgi:hypothetical protein
MRCHENVFNYYPMIQETWLPSRCLAMDVRSDSDNPAFRRHATLFSLSLFGVSPFFIFWGFPLFRFFFSFFFRCQSLPPLPPYVRSSRATPWYGLLSLSFFLSLGTGASMLPAPALPVFSYAVSPTTFYSIQNLKHVSTCITGLYNVRP